MTAARQNLLRLSAVFSGRWCYWGLAACAAVVVWLPKWLPTQDGPQHLRLTSFLMEMRSNSDSPFHKIFHDGLHLTTASLFAWFHVLLSHFCKIETTERLWVSLCILGWAGAAWAWTRAIRPEAPMRAFLFAPFFINWFTTVGFLPYLASVPLAAFAVLMLFEGRGLGRILAASVLLYLCYLAHISSFMVALACSGIWAIRTRRGVWLRISKVAFAFLPTLLSIPFALRVLDVPVSAHQVSMSDRPVFPSVIQVIGQFMMSSLAGVTIVDKTLQACALLLQVGLLVWVVARMFRRTPSGAYEIFMPDKLWVLIVLGLFAFAFSVLPTKVLGWSHAGARVLPFAFLLLPAAVMWPEPGSKLESRLIRALAGTSATILLFIALGWISVGRHLEHVARAASFIQPGARLLPLVFEPGADAPWGPRQSGRSLHSWAIASRLSRSVVPFGFENMRRLMLVARADASPPFPSGPDEDAGRILWNSNPEPQPRVYAQYKTTQADITDGSRFISPAIGSPDFYAKLRNVLLDQIGANYHFLMAIDPPKSLLLDVSQKGWSKLYDEDGIYVFRLRHRLDQDALQF